MPTYQYACTECGHQLEAVQSFSDAALTECPNCHGRLRKVFGAVGVVFKGSGFYRTDSRGKSEAAAEKPAAKSDSTTSGSSSGTSDSSSSTSTSGASTSGSTNGGGGSGSSGSGTGGGAAKPSASTAAK